MAYLNRIERLVVIKRSGDQNEGIVSVERVASETGWGLLHARNTIVAILDDLRRAGVQYIDAKGNRTDYRATEHKESGRITEEGYADFLKRLATDN